MVALMILGMIWLLTGAHELGRLRGPVHYLEAGRSAVADKNWPAALRAVQNVRGKAREEPGFLRLLADYLEGTRSDPALLTATLAKLEQASGLRPDDFIWLCRAFLATGNLSMARLTLDRLPDPARSSSEAFEMQIVLLRAEGRLPEAARMETLLFERFPDHPEVAVRKAANELDGTFFEIRQAALGRLWEIAQRQDNTGMSAMRVLCQQAEPTLEEARRLLQMADKHPFTTLADHLGIVSKVLRLAPLQRETLLQAEIERHKNGSAEVLKQTAAWLIEEKAFEKIQELVPEKVLMGSAELFPFVAQALAEQQQWQKLADLLNKDNQPPVSRARAATWRAVACWNLRPEAVRETRSHLEDAIRNSALEKNSLALLEAARTAEQCSMVDLAFKAYQTMAEPGCRQEVELLEKCWQLATMLKDSAGLKRLAVRLARLRPANVLFAHRRDYLCLLQGEEIETVLLETVAFAGDSEQDSTTCLLKALKAYRMQDLQLATTAIRKVANTAELTSGQRAVYAGLLAASGEAARAYHIAEKIPSELLLQEETVFLKMAL